VNHDEFLRRVLGAPAPPPATEVQATVLKAIACVQRLNALLPCYTVAAPAAAAVILGEAERAMVEAAGHLCDARRMVEAGAAIVSEETPGR